MQRLLMPQLRDLFAATETVGQNQVSGPAASTAGISPSFAIVFDTSNFSASNPNGPAMPQHPALITSTFAPARLSSAISFAGPPNTAL